MYNLKRNVQDMRVIHKYVVFCFVMRTEKFEGVLMICERGFSLSVKCIIIATLFLGFIGEFVPLINFQFGNLTVRG